LILLISGDRCAADKSGVAIRGLGDSAESCPLPRHRQTHEAIGSRTTAAVSTEELGDSAESRVTTIGARARQPGGRRARLPGDRCAADQRGAMILGLGGSLGLGDSLGRRFDSAESCPLPRHRQTHEAIGSRTTAAVSTEELGDSAEIMGHHHRRPREAVGAVGARGYPEIGVLPTSPAP
jgi:hypothetical protein